MNGNASMFYIFQEGAKIDIEFLIAANICLLAENDLHFPSYRNILKSPHNSGLKITWVEFHFSILS